MNLIHDPWVPVRRRSGTIETISPAQITDAIATDPIEAVAAPRPDLTAALVELLIGLLQTAATPADRSAWRRWADEPPSPDELGRLFEPFSEAFKLGGDGPRFLQDLDMRETDTRAADELLIEIAGSQGHFVKTEEHFGLCEPCAAAALYALQTYAPAGGRGHLTSLRGGGPLVTTVLPDPELQPGRATLWHTCWNNVLLLGEWRSSMGEEPAAELSDSVFPWLAPTRTADRLTTPEDVSSLQAYWGMPRRIRLDFNSREDGACGVCAREGPVIKQFFTRPQGVRYAGAWRHPLTPYREDRNGTPVALHPNPSGLGYRQWAALAFGSKADGIMPAATVAGARRRGVGTVAKAVLWAYGYDMDRMKARCWYETRMPVYQLDEAVVEVVRSDVSYMVSASQEVANNLRSCVKRAWFRHVDDAKKRADLAAVTRAFWDRTEPPFFDIVDRVVEARRGSGDATPLLWEWFDVLHRSSLELFETWCHGDETAEPARVALAEIDLRRFNHKKSIKEALHLDARRLAGREKP